MQIPSPPGELQPPFGHLRFQLLRVIAGCPDLKADVKFTLHCPTGLPQGQASFRGDFLPQDPDRQVQLPRYRDQVLLQTLDRASQDSYEVASPSLCFLIDSRKIAPRDVDPSTIFDDKGISISCFLSKLPYLGCRLAAAEDHRNTLFLKPPQRGQSGGEVISDMIQQRSIQIGDYNSHHGFKRRKRRPDKAVRMDDLADAVDSLCIIRATLVSWGAQRSLRPARRREKATVIARRVETFTREGLRAW